MAKTPQSNKPLKAKTPLKAKAKPKKQTKPTITKLKKKADTIYSRATRLRHANMVDGDWVAECITCKATKPIKQLQCGHFMSRQYNATRFDQENTAPQCYGCNVMQQGRQYQFGIEIDLLYGTGTAKKLLKMSKVPHQFTEEELKQIIWDSEQEVLFYEKGVVW